MAYLFNFLTKCIASLRLWFRSFRASPSSKEGIVCAARTDRGSRSDNQDSLYLVQWDDGNTVFAVIADGMGGISHGRIAARLCTSAFAGIFRTKSKFQSWLKQEGFTASAPSFPLRKIVADINQQIMALSKAEDQAVGTTCTALFISDQICWYVHCGDTRLYHIRGNLITQITTDHSDHAQKNLLYNFLGIGDFLNIDIDQLPLLKGDLLLLCSDGLSNALSDSTLQEIATRYPPRVACRKLVKRAKQAAGNGADNVSVILMQYQ